MTRYLFFLGFLSFLASCSKNDSLSDPPYNTPGSNRVDCPDANGFPDLPGWTHKETPISNSYNVYKDWTPFFINENVGFLYGFDGLLLRTSDGGENWQEAGNWPQQYFQQLFFLDDQNGFLSVSEIFASGENVVNGALYKTSDGGITWTKHIYGPAGILQHIFFHDPLNGYAAIRRSPATGSTGSGAFSFARTSDGGLTWTDIAGVVPANLPHSCLHIFPDGFGYLAGTAGRIFKTLDSGLNWEIVHTDLANIQYIRFFDEMNGFVSDFNQILKTTDGGNTWNSIYNGNYIEFLHFFSPNSVFSFQVIGINIYGDVYESCYGFRLTEDGGATWTESQPSNGLFIKQFFFLNEQLGFSTWGSNPGNLVVFEKE